MGRIRTIPEQPSHRPRNSGPDANRRRMHRSEKRKKRAKFIFWLLLGLFILGAMVVLSYTVFFFITDFEVRGNSHYTYDEIVSTAGIPMGENLFKSDRAGAEQNILYSMPYVDAVDVSIKLPSTIVIEVTETKPECVIKWGDKYYLTDFNTKVLDLAQGDVTAMTHVYFDAPDAKVKIGERYLTGENEELLQKFQTVYGALKDNGLIGYITYLDMRDQFAIEFGWGDSVVVELGTPSEIGDKLSMFKTIEPTLSEKGEKGRLDLTQQAKGFFETDK